MRLYETGLPHCREFCPRAALAHLCPHALGPAASLFGVVHGYPPEGRLALHLQAGGRVCGRFGHGQPLFGVCAVTRNIEVTVGANLDSATNKKSDNRDSVNYTHLRENKLSFFWRGRNLQRTQVTPHFSRDFQGSGTGAVPHGTGAGRDHGVYDLLLFAWPYRELGLGARRLLCGPDMVSHGMSCGRMHFVGDCGTDVFHLPEPILCGRSDRCGPGIPCRRRPRVLRAMGLFGSRFHAGADGHEFFVPFSGKHALVPVGLGPCRGGVFLGGSGANLRAGGYRGCRGVRESFLVSGI